MVLLEKHRLIINFKTYREATGTRAEALAKALGMPGVVLAVQNADLYRVSKAVHVPVFAQHLDSAGNGQFTGHDTALALKENGASGVIINHSEDRTSLREIKQLIEICRKAKLFSLVCIDKPALASKIARMRPDAIAIEPPELIGTGISVSAAKPHIVTKAVAAVNSSRVVVLCGAGISKKEDAAKAKQLGCSGVLAASAIILSRNPRKLAKEMLDAMR